jgi:hypothetical protein
MINHYYGLDFDVQFGIRVAALQQYFNYQVKNKQLQGIQVTGEGLWVKVHLSKRDYNRLSPQSKKQFWNVLNKFLYPTRPYRWGQFKHYAALGKRTVGANKQWGGSNNYKTLRFH